MTAMLGYSTTLLPTPIDLTERPSSRSLDRQVIRVDPTFHAERGLQRTGQTPVRVRDHEAVDLPPGSTGEPTVTPYRTPTGRSYSWCGHLRPPREVLPDGRTLDLRPGWHYMGNPGAYSEREDWSLTAVRLLPDGRFEAHVIRPRDREGTGQAP